MASCPGCWLSSSGSWTLPSPAQLLPCSLPRLPSRPDSFLSLPLRAWAQERQALVSSEELAGDMTGAEWLLGQHEELRQEIKEHCLQAWDAQQEGQQLVDKGHFMSLEVCAEVGLGLSWARGPITKALEPPAGEEGQARGGERGREGEGPGLEAFPAHHCWALWPSPPQVALPEHLAHSTPSPPGDRVSAGAGRAAARAQGGLGPVPGTLRGELEAAGAAAGAGPGRGLAGLPGGPPAGPQLRGEPRPCPLAGCTVQQLWPRAGPAAPLLAGHPGPVAEGEVKARQPQELGLNPGFTSPQRSVSDVELLLRRHQDFEKLLAAQEEKFAQLQRKVEVSKAGPRVHQETGA